MINVVELQAFAERNGFWFDDPVEATVGDRHSLVWQQDKVVLHLGYGKSHWLTISIKNPSSIQKYFIGSLSDPHLSLYLFSVWCEFCYEAAKYANP